MKFVKLVFIEKHHYCKARGKTTSKKAYMEYFILNYADYGYLT